MKIKVLELFAGYGGGSFALKQLGVDFEVVGYSEIDKYAIQCYEQNHKGKNLGDITKINEKEIPDFDLLMGGFPCQSFSVAGKRLGIADKRGQLFWDIIRIAKEKQPKYMLLENVKGITIGKNKVVFEQMKQDLRDIGYNVYTEVLNTKNYGIPQSRDRVYFVCIRKDLDKDFRFPEPVELKIFLKDILDDEVDEKYYLKEKHLKNLRMNNNGKIREKNVGSNQIIQINRPKHSNNRVYSPKGISPTLNTMSGGNRQPFIIASRGRYNKNGKIEQHIEPRKDYVSNSLTTFQKDNYVYIRNARIRKLTPIECFRLMGFLDDEIKLDGLSDTQKYKLAGNGWTLSPIKEILNNLLSI